MLQKIRAYTDREIVVIPSVLEYLAVMKGWQLTAAPLGRLLHDRFIDIPEEAWALHIPQNFSPGHIPTVISVMKQTSIQEEDLFQRRPLLEIYSYDNGGMIGLYETTEKGLFQLNIYCVHMASKSSLIRAKVVTEWGHGHRVETRDANSKHHLITAQAGSTDIWREVKALLAERYSNIRLERQRHVRA